MDLKIPVTTDSIYKFMATFGLVIIVVSLSLLVLNNKTTNDTIWEKGQSYFSIDKNDPNLEDKETILVNQVELARSNHALFIKILSGIFGAGIIISWTGFQKWRKLIQPLQDELLRLEVEKLRLEVASLQTSQPTTEEK